jgi:hypothetical protein
MLLRIVVSNALNGYEAMMRKSTFAEIHRIKNLGVPYIDSAIIMGTPFEAAYMLRFVEDYEADADVLYVSSAVKAHFYPDKPELNLTPVC